MTSQKQAEANRRNAEKSTGPRTPQGKTTAAANSTTHGATATIYRPIRHENPADHHAIRAGLIETWNPQTPQEYQL
ncbi:MAG: hypothetical protein SGI92_14055, partial [Bryobacteraceae bacterium]|nr:hypothetical protein [Bryobacteraceae bacterium]